MKTVRDPFKIDRVSRRRRRRRTERWRRRGSERSADTCCPRDVRSAFENDSPAAALAANVFSARKNPLSPPPTTTTTTLPPRTAVRSKGHRVVWRAELLFFFFFVVFNEKPNFFQGIRVGHDTCGADDVTNIYKTNFFLKNAQVFFALSHNGVMMQPPIKPFVPMLLYVPTYAREWRNTDILYRSSFSFLSFSAKITDLG